MQGLKNQQQQAGCAQIIWEEITQRGKEDEQRIKGAHRNKRGNARNERHERLGQ